MLTIETTTKMSENGEQIEVGTESTPLRTTTEKLDVPNGASDSDLVRFLRFLASFFLSFPYYPS